MRCQIFVSDKTHWIDVINLQNYRKRFPPHYLLYHQPDLQILSCLQPWLQWPAFSLNIFGQDHSKWRKMPFCLDIWIKISKTDAALDQGQPHSPRFRKKKQNGMNAQYTMIMHSSQQHDCWTLSNSSRYSFPTRNQIPTHFFLFFVSKNVNITGQHSRSFGSWCRRH